MSTGNFNLTIYRGVALGFTVALTEDDGTTPVDLTGLTPRWLARPKVTGDVAWDFAPEVTDAEGGLLRVEMTTAQTLALDPKTYVHDLVLEITATGERTQRALAGTVTVTSAVTRGES